MSVRRSKTGRCLTPEYVEKSLENHSAWTFHLYGPATMRIIKVIQFISETGNLYYQGPSHRLFNILLEFLAI